MAEQKANKFLERQEDAEKLSATGNDQEAANHSPDNSEVKSGLDVEGTANA